MKNVLFIVLASLMLSSCADNDEPTPEVFTQIAEITDGKSVSHSFLYDDYGRVVKYVASFPDETVSSTYTYVSDDMIKIHTEHAIHYSLNEEEAQRVYDDEMHLENGRAKYCEGIFSTNQFGQDQVYQKKYRQEFAYTPGNHLNVVKNTEWNKKGDSWADDAPWRWEIYYIWTNNNLTSIEDYAGNNAPAYTYKYNYSSVSGVQNVLPIHLARFQYFPLQLKGYFGAEPANLITGVERIGPDASNSTTTYQYTITDNKITAYIVTQAGNYNSHSVSWTK